MADPPMSRFPNQTWNMFFVSASPTPGNSRRNRFCRIHFGWRSGSAVGPGLPAGCWFGRGVHYPGRRPLWKVPEYIRGISSDSLHLLEVRTGDGDQLCGRVGGQDQAGLVAVSVNSVSEETRGGFHFGNV